MTIRILLALWLLALTPVATATGLAHLGGRITGTVELSGCAIDPTLLEIEATPLSIRLASDRHDWLSRLRNRTQRAWIRSTDDPHVVRFYLWSLDRTTPQQLRIGYGNESCGKVFWRGPDLGLAMPGGEPVHIEGVAASTEVEVFEDETGDWVGATRLNFSGGNLGQMRFRWRTRISDATHGEVQVATSAFPTEGEFNACSEPAEGLIYRSDVAFEGEEFSELPAAIDLRAALLPTVVGGIDDAIGIPPAGLPDDARRRIASVLAGAPLYVRIIPHTADGPACNARRDGLHGWSMVGVVPQIASGEFPPGNEPPPPQPLEAGDGHLYMAPFTGGIREGLPTFGMISWITIKQHTLPPERCSKLGFAQPSFAYWATDPLGCQLIELGVQYKDPNLEPGRTLQPGFWFQYNPPPSGGSSGGLLSNIGTAFGGLVTGTWGFLGDAVSLAGKLWDEIKSTVAKYALKVLTTVPGLQQFCAATGDACKKAIEYGMAAGMAAIGIPPSLPNFQELQDQGLEYLASQIAEETGIPSELTEEALQYTRNLLEEMNQGRGGSSPVFNWVQPYLGYSPATVEIVVRKNTPDLLPPLLALDRPATSLHLAGRVPLPRRFIAGDEMRIPMVLHPDFSQFPPPICSYNRAGQGGCVGNSLLKAPLCRREMWQGPGQGWSWQVVDCDHSFGYISPVALYYRDRWVQERVKATACSWVGAKSVIDFLGITLPPAPGYDFQTAALVKPQEWFQWSGTGGNNCF